MEDFERSAFGELKIIEPTPVIQIDALMGLREVSDVEVVKNDTGNVEVENTGTGYEFKCTTGSAAGGGSLPAGGGA